VSADPLVYLVSLDGRPSDAIERHAMPSEAVLDERRLEILDGLLEHDPVGYMRALNMTYAIARGLIEGRLTEALARVAPVSHIVR
jgi:hypothetical protein